MKSGNYCSKGVQKVARTLQDLLTISTPQIIVTQHNDRLGAQIEAKERQPNFLGMLTSWLPVPYESILAAHKFLNTREL